MPDSRKFGGGLTPVTDSTPPTGAKPITAYALASSDAADAAATCARRAATADAYSAKCLATAAARLAEAAATLQACAAGGWAAR